MHDGNIREAYVRVRRYPLHSARPKIKLYYSYVRDEIPYLGAFSDERKDSLGCTMTRKTHKAFKVRLRLFLENLVDYCEWFIRVLF